MSAGEPTGQIWVKDYGCRLKEALHVRGMNKHYLLSLRLDVNESTVSRWLNGGPLSLTNVARICLVLDASVDWLLLGRNDIDHHKAFSINNQERCFIEWMRTHPPAFVNHVLAFPTVSDAVSPHRRDLSDA